MPALSLLVAPLALFSQLESSDIVCAKPHHCVAPIARGASAPFDGMLLTIPRAIVLGLAAEHCDERLELELRKERDLFAARYERQHDRLRAETADLETALAKERAEVQRLSRWTRDPLFWFGFGAAVTVGSLLVFGRLH